MRTDTFSYKRNHTLRVLASQLAVLECLSTYVNKLRISYKPVGGECCAAEQVVADDSVSVIFYGSI